ncbi:MAG: hypothetical protein ACYC1C_21080, partial [Chloroflexota bacterium]
MVRDFGKRNRLLLVLALLGLVGLVSALFLREYSFPVATVHFQVLRGDAENIARSYLSERGFDVSGYYIATAFEVDDSGKSYVEQQAGLAALNRLGEGDIAIWRWHVRFFRELQEEEFSVYITPNGHVTGFSQVLPESTPGANPTVDEARAQAEAFLAGLGGDTSTYRSISATKVERDARTDYVFTWEDSNFKLGDATYRTDVWTHGDQIGGYYQYLKVPEDWLRAEAVQANNGILLARFGWLLTYALGLAAALVCLFRVRAGRVGWRFAVILAGVMAVIAIAVGVNSFPLYMMGYPTTSTLASYLAGGLLSLATSLIPTGLAVVLAGIAGDWLYANLLRQRVPPRLLLS